MVKSIRNTASVFAIILLLTSCVQSSVDRANHQDLDSVAVQETVALMLPVYARVLEQCYGGHFSLLDSNHIVWNDGDTLILDDGKQKDCQSAIETADIEDQFRVVYPKGTHLIPVDSCFDPGRIRNELFFRKMYGMDEQAVKINLDTVMWPSLDNEQVLLVNTVNGCRDSLRKVAEALRLLPDSLLDYVSPSSGTFKYRTIAGTNRLSCHSFGIAVDINVTHSHYWRWARDKHTVSYKNAIPFAVVEVFEKYGFIWGGYWYHYDTMHFEFRPELIKYSKYE